MGSQYKIEQRSNQGASTGYMDNHGTVYDTHAPESPVKSDVDKALEVMRWISPQDFTTTYGQLRESVVPGTGQWFLQSEEFKAWRRRDKKYLWVSGKPGAGKSFLSTIVINELKRDQVCQVAFLYLSYKQETSEKNLLGNLASQLIAQRIDLPELPDIVQTLWNSEHDKTKKEPFQQAPEFSQLEQLLSALVTNDTFLVIDALDEFDSSQHHSLLYRLKRIHNANPNLLITSRDKKAEGFDAIDVIANDKDIKKYIEQAISRSRLSDFMNQDSTLREEITIEVAKKADGMFLLPRLHMEALATNFSASDVRKVLNRLPHDQNSAYESTLERINNQEKMREWAMTAIGWIFHAQEPLQVDELRHALLIGGAIGQPFKSGDALFSHRNLLSEEAIVASCCGLVKIECHPDGWDTFRFIHYSVQEFFASHQQREKLFPDFHARISLACTKYACLPRLVSTNHGSESIQRENHQDGRGVQVEEYQEYERLQKNQKQEQLSRKQLYHGFHLPETDPRFWTDCTNDRGILKSPQQFDLKFLLYPLLNYAGRHLGHHFSNIGQNHGRLIVEEQICALMQIEENRHFYLHLVSFNNSAKDLSRVSSKLELAAYIGSVSLVEKLLPREMRDWPGERALRVAMNSNQPCIVKFILGLGGAVDLTASSGHDLLSQAVRYNYKRNYRQEVSQVIVEIREYLTLLEDTENSKSWTTRTSEQFARTFHPSRVASYLFGAINPIKLVDHIRLLSASTSGDSAEVLNILEKKCVILSKDNTESRNTLLRTKSCLVKSSFFLAIENLHSGVVKVFLDHGIDVNIQGVRDDETPLHRAISRESFPMVELLLGYNARTDLKDIWRTVLQQRVGSEIIKPLLRASTTQPLALGYASGAFVDAVLLKRSDLIKAFLESGIDPSIKSQFGLRPGLLPLQVAVRYEDTKTMRLLLEYNADPNFLVLDKNGLNEQSLLDVVFKEIDKYPRPKDRVLKFFEYIFESKGITVARDV
ncbi:hypothetical protein HDK90DRAFT_555636 [Phyllosticta capitalensis]|uniref:Nephrocystin 3-like N-terminal domain-containing protein n=1 Tax=Phyllosticta capitalensis TaxID=121624 RepID=A0ABR1YL64_9PEZI